MKCIEKCIKLDFSLFRDKKTKSGPGDLRILKINKLRLNGPPKVRKVKKIKKLRK